VHALEVSGIVDVLNHVQELDDELGHKFQAWCTSSQAILARSAQFYAGRAKEETLALANATHGDNELQAELVEAESAALPSDTGAGAAMEASMREMDLHMSPEYREMQEKAAQLKVENAYIEARMKDSHQVSDLAYKSLAQITRACNLEKELVVTLEEKNTTGNALLAVIVKSFPTTETLEALKMRKEHLEADLVHCKTMKDHETNRLAIKEDRDNTIADHAAPQIARIQENEALLDEYRKLSDDVGAVRTKGAELFDLENQHFSSTYLEAAPEVGPEAEAMREVINAAHAQWSTWRTDVTGSLDRFTSFLATRDKQLEHLLATQQYIRADKSPHLSTRAGTEADFPHPSFCDDIEKKLQEISDAIKHVSSLS